MINTAITFEEMPPTAGVVAVRTDRRPRLPWWVAVEAGEIVGYAHASRHRSRAAYRWAVDVSIYLAGSHCGQGLGAALYRRLLAEVRGLGYISAYAGIALPNPASVRLHEGAGFTGVGVFRSVGYKLGRWHDVGWWHLPLADPPTEPVEPHAWEPPQP